MRVNVEKLTNENGTMPIMDIVQWCHNHNPNKQNFGISFRTYNGLLNIFLETDCASIMNAVQNQWPNAVIENPYTIGKPRA